MKIFRAVDSLVSSEEDFEWERVAITEATTDNDGRGQLKFNITAGVYKTVYYVSSYFERTGTPSFYPKIEITFRISDPSSHYHVPVILGPFGYSTYRGS